MLSGSLAAKLIRKKYTGLFGFKTGFSLPRNLDFTKLI